MQTYNIHDAKTHLSRLIEQVVAGGAPFVIAKAGKEMVKVVPFVEQKKQRLGFLAEQFNVPDDFDTMGSREISEMFGGQSS